MARRVVSTQARDTPATVLPIRGGQAHVPAARLIRVALAGVGELDRCVLRAAIAAVESSAVTRDSGADPQMADLSDDYVEEITFGEHRIEAPADAPRRILPRADGGSRIELGTLVIESAPDGTQVALCGRTSDHPAATRVESLRPQASSRTATPRPPHVRTSSK